MRILVSACLAGYSCRYDGKANTVGFIQKLHECGLALAVCPECLGGLPVPRTPCEISGDRVISREGRDCTDNFLYGAFHALQYSRFYGAGLAILKAKSPSCGLGQVYDGTFSKRLIAGDGYFVRLLKQHNFIVCTEKDDFAEKILAHYGKLHIY